MGSWTLDLQTLDLRPRSAACATGRFCDPCRVECTGCQHYRGRRPATAGLAHGYCRPAFQAASRHGTEPADTVTAPRKTGGLARLWQTIQKRGILVENQSPAGYADQSNHCQAVWPVETGAILETDDACSLHDQSRKDARGETEIRRRSSCDLCIVGPSAHRLPRDR